MLDFLLEKQRVISVKEEEEGYKFPPPSSSSSLVLVEPWLEIPHWVCSEDFYPFWKSQEPRAIPSHKAACFFHIPGVFLPPPAGIFNIQSGFFSCEWDIQRAAALGYQGLFFFARGQDYFKLQLCTEIARDLQISLIFIVTAYEELTEILKTDAPYLALWGYGTNGVSFLFKAISKVPQSAGCWALAPPLKSKQVELIKKQGYRGIITPFSAPAP